MIAGVRKDRRARAGGRDEYLLAMRHARSLMLAIFALLGCTDSTRPASPTVASVTVLAGDGQLAPEFTAVLVRPSVVVKDAANRPVPGVRVTFAAADPRDRVEGAVATTDESGTATVGSWTLDSASVAAHTLVATAMGFTARFTARAYGAPVRIDATAGTSQVAEVGTPVLVRPAARVTDRVGNPVPGVRIDFNVIAGSGTVTGSPAVSDSAGVATVGAWTLGAYAGKEALQARLMSANGQLVSDATYLAVATAGPAFAIRYVGGDIWGAASTPLATSPVVSVVDRYGNALYGVEVTFTVADGGGTLTDSVRRTGALGPFGQVGASPGGFTPGPSLGTQTILASAGSLSVGIPIAVRSEAPASIVIVEGDAQRIVFGNALPLTPTIVVRDASGRPVPNVAVSWSATGCLPRPDEVTTGAGVASYGICSDWSPAIGVNAITARVGTLSATFTETVLAPPATVTFLSPATSPLEVGPATDVPIAVRVLLADGGPAVGYPVDIGIPGSAPRYLTDARGIATTTYRVPAGSAPGSRTVTATVTSTMRSSITVNVVAFVDFLQIAAGSAHTCGISYSSGGTFCWGSNASGQFGDGTLVGRPVPTRSLPGIGYVTYNPEDMFSASADFSCHFYAWLVQAPRTVNAYHAKSCWGRRRDGGVAAVPLTVQGSGLSDVDVNESFGVPGFDATKLDSTVARRVEGKDHACVITDKGTAYCWGSNAFGQLGDGTTIDRASPVRVAGGLAFRATLPMGGAALAIGSAHTCAVELSGAAYCWGRNDDGQLGDGTTASRSTPTRVASPLGFTALGAGGAHSCGIAVGGSAYCWGSNSDGQLGTGSLMSAATPALVSGGGTYTVIATGDAHTCAVQSTSHHAQCWGRNRDGQLGDGTTINRSVPTPVSEYRP